MSSFSIFFPLNIKLYCAVVEQRGGGVCTLMGVTTHLYYRCVQLLNECLYFSLTVGHLQKKWDLLSLLKLCVGHIWYAYACVTFCECACVCVYTCFYAYK